MGALQGAEVSGSACQPPWVVFLAHSSSNGGDPGRLLLASMLTAQGTAAGVIGRPAPWTLMQRTLGRGVEIPWVFSGLFPRA